MELSRYLRDKAREIAGRSQFFINSYAKALEVRILALLVKLAVRHDFKHSQWLMQS